MSWRSPQALPMPPDPARVRFPSEPLARLAFGAAWRLRAFGHALAHGLRRVPGGQPHRLVLRRIERALVASDAFAAHPALLAHDGGETPDRLVQARLRLEPLPNAESWAEIAVADALVGAALDRALEGLASSSDEALARAAREAPAAEPCGAAWLAALAEDAANRACLQLLVERWMRESVLVFGRPGSDGDRAASESGWRAPAATLLASHLDVIERTLWDCGLETPDAMLMGVTVPGDWTPRRLSRAPRQPGQR